MAVNSVLFQFITTLIVIAIVHDHIALTKVSVEIWKHNSIATTKSETWAVRWSDNLEMSQKDNTESQILTLYSTNMVVKLYLNWKKL